MQTASTQQPLTETKKKLNMIERIAELHGIALTTTLFPVETISDQWFTSAVAGLRDASIASLRIVTDQFVGLLELDEKCGPVPLTLFQLGVLCNNLEERTPEQLGLRFRDYANILRETDRHAATFKIINAELKKKCEEQAAAESQAAKAAHAAAALGMKAVKDEE